MARRSSNDELGNYGSDYLEPGRGLSMATGAQRLRVFDKRLLHLGAGEERPVALMVVINLAVSATFVMQSVCLAIVLDRVLAGGGLDEVTGPGSLAAALVLVRVALVYAHDAAGAASGARIAGRLRTRLYSKLVQLGPGWAGSRRSGELQFTLVDGVESLEQYFSQFVAKALSVTITTAGVVVALVVIDPITGAVVAVCVALAATGPILSWRILGPRLKHWWTASPALAADFVDSTQGVTTLKAMNASERRGEQLKHQAGLVHRANMRLLDAELGWLQPFGVLESAVVVVVVVLGGARLGAGDLGAGELLLLLMLSGEAVRPLFDLKRSMHFSISGMGAAEKILDVLEEPVPEVRSQPVGWTAPPSAPLLAFDDVTYRYRAGDQPAVDALSFVLPQGRRLAIVGRSGAGKSTVVSLLLRFLDAQEGTVLWRGRDVRTMRPEAVREQVALVAQDTYLLQGTIRDNLLLADPHADDRRLREVLRRAAAPELVGDVANLDTVVGERGMRLSGGQRQRLAIARALLSPAPLLVLDEATSSLDVAHEQDVHTALGEAAEGRTVLIVAHRLSTVRTAHEILVLDRGRLSESGSHGGLLKLDGVYSSLVQLDRS